MYPHADTLYTINTLDYPRRLRHAANERLAASAQSGKHSPSIMPAAVQRFAAVLFAGLPSRLRGAYRGSLSRQPPSVSARSAHRAI